MCETIIKVVENHITTFAEITYLTIHFDNVGITLKETQLTTIVKPLIVILTIGKTILFAILIQWVRIL